MRFLRLLLAFALLFAAACNRQSADAPLTEAEMVANAKRDVTACTRAFFDQDYTTFQKYVPQKLVNAIGSDKKFRASLQRATMDWNDKGLYLKEITAGDPEPPFEVAGRMVTHISQRLVMTTPKGNLRTNSWLLGISDNGGRDWVFIDMAQTTQQKLRILFPDLAGKIETRPRETPVLEEE